jgi:hypothetical protein
MSKVNAEHLAKLCNVSPVWLGGFMARVDFALDSEGKFDAEDLWDRLERGKPKSASTEKNAEDTAVALRTPVLDLFHRHKISARWKAAWGTQKNTVLVVSLPEGKEINVAVRSATSGIKGFSFFITAPFLPWYCFVLGSADCVMLKRSDELTNVVNWKDREKLNVVVKETDVDSLFVNQVEFLKQDLMLLEKDETA